MGVSINQNFEKKESLPDSLLKDTFVDYIADPSLSEDLNADRKYHKWIDTVIYSVNKEVKSVFEKKLIDLLQYLQSNNEYIETLISEKDDEKFLSELKDFSKNILYDFVLSEEDNQIKIHLKNELDKRIHVMFMKRLIWKLKKLGVIEEINGVFILKSKKRTTNKSLHSALSILIEQYKIFDPQNDEFLTAENLLNYLDLHIGGDLKMKTLDEEGNSIHISDQINDLYKINTSDQEIFNRILKFIKTSKPLRLNLNKNQQEIPIDEVNRYIDEENGYLCFLEERNGQKFYRKLNRKDIYFLITNSVVPNRKADKNNLTSIKHLRENFEKAGIELKNSDIFSVNFILQGFRKVSRNQESIANISTRLIDGVRYFLPKKFTVEDKKTKKQVSVNLDNDKGYSMQISSDYAIFIIESQNSQTPLFLKLDPDLRNKRFKRTEETAKSLSLFNPADFVDHYEGESIEDYVGRTAQISFSFKDFLPLYRKIFDKSNFNLQKYSLKKVVQFISYYNQNPELQNSIEDLLSRYGERVFNAFQLCSLDWSTGKILIKMAKDHDEDEVSFLLDYLSEIMEISDKHMTENKEKSKSFRSVVMRKSVKLLQEAAETNMGLKEFIENTKKFSADVIISGAAFSAVSTKIHINTNEPESVNEALRDLKIQVFKGGNLIKSTERKDMEFEENYTNPAVFNSHNYQSLVSFLKESYSKIDPGWMEYLTDKIADDLNNPNVTFVTIKDRSGKLVGICKAKKLEEKLYYFGTLYVDPIFQTDYKIGKYLDSYLRESVIPENAKIFATVASQNKALVRHIEESNFLGYGFTKEGDDNFESKDLLALTYDEEIKLKTRDKEKFSKDKIIDLYNNPDKIENAKIIIKKINIDDISYVEQTRPLFEEGYLLSRVVRQNQKTSEVLLVFEKNDL